LSKKIQKKNKNLQKVWVVVGIVGKPLMSGISQKSF
jgi:hypothetical protein